jgi:hypothetical protein
MDTLSSFKNCLLCRARRREARKPRIKVTTMKHITAQDLNRKYDATSASMKDPRENAAHHEGSQKLSTGVKRAAPKSLSELEGEERLVALKMAKKSLTEIIQRQGKKPMPNIDAKSVSCSVCSMKYLY